MPQVVVITGASAGVGRACALEFAKRGDSIGLIARETQRLEAAKREVEEAGGRALMVAADVAQFDQLEVAAARIEAEFGPIDIWVNNAMTTVFSPFHEIAPAEFRRATEVTYLGVVYGTMVALARMKGRDRGTIVQVGSALAYRGTPLQSAYCGAKHAIRGFTDSLRCELLHDRSQVHLTMVQLPALNTPQFSWCKTRLPHHPQPVPPIFQPEVAARAIVWAAEHRRREVQVARTTVITIWGNKFFPGWGDRYLARNGYDGQQTSQPVPSDRPANLFEPVAGDLAAHGIFDDLAASSSWQWWLTTHRSTVWAVVVILLSLTCGLLALWLLR